MFNLKHAGDGTVERFKARLEAKGYALKYGIDFDETFSPAVRFSSIRLLLACANENLIGYSDADWAGHVDDRHSTSGNVFSFACRAVS